jgi:hypothetical protein
MDLVNLGVVISAEMSADGADDEITFAKGHYELECRDSEGNLLWAEGFDNIVPYSGKNLLAVSGAVAGGTAYLGLISASGYAGAPTINDTIGSHSNWEEASSTFGPGYGTTRPTLTLAAPVSGVISNTASPASYTFTTGGTVQGAFAVAGPGASNVVGNTTGGTLLSAGVLTTPQPVIEGNTVTMTYTLTVS